MSLASELAAATAEIKRLTALVDPPICRLQLPDGVVAGNLKEAAELWKWWYEKTSSEVILAKSELELAWRECRGTREQRDLARLNCRNADIERASLADKLAAVKAVFDKHGWDLSNPDDIADSVDREFDDFEMVMSHCRQTYSHFSDGRISKPQTLPEEVFSVAEDLQQDDWAERLKEETAEIIEERDQARRQTIEARNTALEWMNAVLKRYPQNFAWDPTAPELMVNNAVDTPLAAAREEAQELNELFDLQHTRMAEATKRWRAANPGNEHVLPDLGALLEWLLKELNERNRCRVHPSLDARYCAACHARTIDAFRRISAMANDHSEYGACGYISARSAPGDCGDGGGMTPRLAAGRVLLKTVAFMRAEDALRTVVESREREEVHEPDGAFIGMVPVDDPEQRARYKAANRRRYAAKRSLLAAVRRLKRA